MRQQDEEPVLISCWNCEMEMNLIKLGDNDGFCFACDSEIELTEEPYKSQLQNQITEVNNNGNS